MKRKLPIHILFLSIGLSPFVHVLSAQLNTIFPSKTPTITVWIHGSRVSKFFKHILNLETIFNCKKGLHKATSLKKNEHFYCIAQELSGVSPKKFPQKYFYIFGWSGKVQHIERQNAAKELYYALTDLAASYLMKYETKPLINIITHSHGGNVVLNMANVTDQECPFKINKLILLACPVQNYTVNLIKSPLFKKIYSIHSHTDTLQVLDPQGLHPFLNFECLFIEKFINTFLEAIKIPLFSQRHFPTNPKIIHASIYWKKGSPWQKTLPQNSGQSYLKPVKNLTQFLDKIKLNRGLVHIEFTLLPFITHLPQIIDQLDIVMNKAAHCISNTNPDTVIQL